MRCVLARAASNHIRIQSAACCLAVHLESQLLRMGAAGSCKEAIASQCQDVELGDSQVADCLSQIAQAAEFAADAGECGLPETSAAALNAGQNFQDWTSAPVLRAIDNVAVRAGDVSVEQLPCGLQDRGNTVVMTASTAAAGQESCSCNSCRQEGNKQLWWCGCRWLQRGS
jgi:hypothetical protein